MSDLLDITDNSDPLNIRKGNPGLKPSFTQNLRIFYNNYTQRRQRSIATWAGLNTTSNAISNKVTLDKSTGARITQPENINGNWNGYAGMVFNTAIDTAAFFNVNTFTNVGFNHYVGYASVDMKSESQKSVTNSLSSMSASQPATAMSGSRSSSTVLLATPVRVTTCRRTTTSTRGSSPMAV